MTDLTRTQWMWIIGIVVVLALGGLGYAYSRGDARGAGEFPETCRFCLVKARGFANFRDFVKCDPTQKVCVYKNIPKVRCERIGSATYNDSDDTCKVDWATQDCIGKQCSYLRGGHCTTAGAIGCSPGKMCLYDANKIFPWCKGGPKECLKNNCKAFSGTYLGDGTCKVTNPNPQGCLGCDFCKDWVKGKEYPAKSPPELVRCYQPDGTCWFGDVNKSTCDKWGGEYNMGVCKVTAQ